MNDEPIDDPELRRHLDAARNHLRGGRPRPDQRLEHLLGAAPPPPPSPTLDDDPTVPLRLPAVASPRRRAAWVAGLAAAALVLFGALAAVAARNGDAPPLSVAGTADETDDGATTKATADDQAPEGDGDAEGEGTDEAHARATDDGGPEPDSPEAFGEHREWVECIVGELHQTFADGGWRVDDRTDLDLDLTAACGEPPEFGDLPAPGPDGEWRLEPPHLDGEWDLDDWEGFGLDGVCERESSGDGTAVRCVWPPCDDGDECPAFPCDDPDAQLCLDLELPDDLEQWLHDALPDDLEQWLHDALPDDLEQWFHDALPDDLEQWFEGWGGHLEADRTDSGTDA